MKSTKLSGRIVGIEVNRIKLKKPRMNFKTEIEKGNQNYKDLKFKIGFEVFSHKIRERKTSFMNVFIIIPEI